METWFKILVWSGCLMVIAVQAEEPPKRVVVVAHRGNHEAAHENTLEAIRNAIAIKVDYVELDIRRTKDGRHILMHDGSVKRMTGVDAKVNALTFQEIRALKVSDSNRPNIPVSSVPTFEEALDAMGSAVGLYLDFKDGDPEFLAAELRKRDHVKRTVVYLNGDEMEAWKKAEPSIRFIVSVPGNKLTPSALDSFLIRMPGIILDGSIQGYTKELVQMAHTRGNPVWPDIQNPGENPEQWARALELGVDGLQTDHPSTLITYLTTIGRH